MTGLLGSLVGQLSAPLRVPSMAEQLAAMNAGRTAAAPPPGPGRLSRSRVILAQLTAATAGAARPVTTGRLKRLADLLAWVEQHEDGCTAPEMAEFHGVTFAAMRNDLVILKRYGFLEAVRIKHPGRSGPQCRYYRGEKCRLPR